MLNKNEYLDMLSKAKNSTGRMFEIEKPEFKLVNKAGKTEILIYDEISDYGVSVKDVSDALSKASGKLVVRINSPGGNVFDGVAIYNILADVKNLEVIVDGLAASAASIIAMAGSDLPTMNNGAIMMIHRAWTVAAGNAEDLAKTIKTLETVDNGIVSIFSKKTGLSEEVVHDMLKKETWMTSDEAVAAGFARAPEGKEVKNTTEVDVINEVDGNESEIAALIAAELIKNQMRRS